MQTPWFGRDETRGEIFAREVQLMTELLAPEADHRSLTTDTELDWALARDASEPQVAPSSDSAPVLVVAVNAGNRWDPRALAAGERVTSAASVHRSLHALSRAYRDAS